MTSVKLPNRSREYRRRAEEARTKAESTRDPRARQTLLHDAELWERMARWEDINNPAMPGDLAWRP